MGMKAPDIVSIEALFDVSEPYLFVLVLPALILFAIGHRRQAALFALGASAFLALAGMA